MSVGMRGSLAIAPTGSWPTSMYFIPFLSEGVTPTKDAQVTKNIRGRFDEGDVYKGQATIEGEISLEPTPITLKRMLNYWFGQTSSYIAANSVYTHELLPRNTAADYESSLPELSFMITKERDGGQNRSLFLENVWIDTFTLTFDASALVNMSVGIKAWNYSYVSSVYTPVYDDDQEYTWQQNSASYAGADWIAYPCLT